MTPQIRLFDGQFRALEIERESDAAVLEFQLGQGDVLAVTMPLESLGRLSDQLAARQAEYGRQRRPDPEKES